MTWGIYGEAFTMEINENIKNDWKGHYNIHYKKDFHPQKSMDRKNLKSMKAWGTGPICFDLDFLETLMKRKHF